MIRRNDWETALGEYLAKHQNAVFVFGKLDCALFASGAVRTMTGKDLARGLRGKYRSVAGSVRTLKGLGFDSLAALVDSKLEAVPVSFAQRGDIVMDASDSLGVCVGREALFVGEEDGDAGLVRLPMASWVRAWRVPFE